MPSHPRHPTCAVTLTALSLAPACRAGLLGRERRESNPPWRTVGRGVGGFVRAWPPMLSLPCAPGGFASAGALWLKAKYYISHISPLSRGRGFHKLPDALKINRRGAGRCLIIPLGPLYPRLSRLIGFGEPLYRVPTLQRCLLCINDSFRRAFVCRVCLCKS